MPKHGLHRTFAHRNIFNDMVQGLTYHRGVIHINGRYKPQRYSASICIDSIRSSQDAIPFRSWAIVVEMQGSNALNYTNCFSNINDLPKRLLLPYLLEQIWLWRMGMVGGLLSIFQTHTHTHFPWCWLILVGCSSHFTFSYCWLFVILPCCWFEDSHGIFPVVVGYSMVVAGGSLGTYLVVSFARRRVSGGALECIMGPYWSWVNQISQKWFGILIHSHKVVVTAPRKQRGYQALMVIYSPTNKKCA